LEDLAQEGKHLFRQDIEKIKAWCEPCLLTLLLNYSNGALI